MSRRFFWFIVVAIVLMGGLALLFVLGREQTDTTSVSQTDDTQLANTDTSRLLIGDPKAPLTIVEYGDYKCPECGKYHQAAGKQIREQYIDTGKANLEFRPFPLFGEDAGLALYASYCATEQGKFAAYYDTLFGYMWQNYYQYGNEHAASDTIFTNEKLAELAKQAGLDGQTFSTCAAGKTYEQNYNAAVDKAAGDSVQGTPSVIIRGQKIVGPQPFAIYKTLLDAGV
ncbi:DsbA family protein [Candidatus Saccharibacteria bacterium]|nr:DsbA family protein [Candidatus Saccharibacteria bacterium]